LVEALEARLESRTTAEWLSEMEAAGLPAGPVLDIVEMQRDPQTLAREMVVEVPHSRLGPVKTIGLPVKFSATPGGVLRGAPEFGEHTREVLGEHDYAASEIDRLISAGAVAACTEGGR
ncbi:MAG TPA: CoA transferase, partial [Chromatiales bacterium]|nr:CoA transferase [Chromatiales bacterium]